MRRIALIFEPTSGIGSSSGALNLIRYRPDLFVPVASHPIAGRPGLAQVDSLLGEPINYPVASLMAGLEKVDPDGVLIYTIGGDVLGALDEMAARWPVAWRFNVNPIELDLTSVMLDKVMYILGALSKVDAVVTCTEFSERNLNALAIDNTVTIPVGLDTEKFKPAEPEGDRVVSFTRLSPVKNLLASIMTMSSVVSRVPSAEYKMYGDGGRSGFIANIMLQLPTDRISYEGSRPVEEILAGSKVMLQQSLSENQSLSCLEAMAAKIPVVCSDIPGHPRSGVRVRHESVSDAADAVEKLLTDEDYRQRKIREGYREVKNYDVRRVAPMFEELFSKLDRLHSFKKHKEPKEPKGTNGAKERK